jgi:hypothetical protein
MYAFFTLNVGPDENLTLRGRLNVRFCITIGVRFAVRLAANGVRLNPIESLTID